MTDPTLPQRIADAALAARRNQRELHQLKLRDDPRWSEIMMMSNHSVELEDLLWSLVDLYGHMLTAADGEQARIP